jgi:hypothetical protein
MPVAPLLRISLLGILRRFCPHCRLVLARCVGDLKRGCTVDAPSSVRDGQAQPVEGRRPAVGNQPLPTWRTEEHLAAPLGWRMEGASTIARCPTRRDLLYRGRLDRHRDALSTGAWGRAIADAEPTACFPRGHGWWPGGTLELR